MSKVLVIMGSPRTGGNTNILCQKFVKMLKKEIPEKDVYVANIGFESELHPCKCCGACIEECPIDDSIKEILLHFDESDFVVWFTPIYFFQMTGQSKVLIDRLGASDKWEGKHFYFAFISGSSGRFGGEDILFDIVERIAEWHNSYLGVCYHKMTNDEILPVNDKDLKFFTSVITDIKECMNNEII